MLTRIPRALPSAALRVVRVSAPINATSSLTTICSSSSSSSIRLQPSSSRFPCAQGFHSTACVRKGIFPDSPDPPSPSPQSHNISSALEPSPLTDQDYHEFSEHYLDLLLEEVENAQEYGATLEAEYSAGVLHVIVPRVGTYVLNKQPPNKQIWLSSPISGPKRYDWIVEGDQIHEKQDTRPFVNGQWICLRDGSNLTDLLNSELGLNLPEDIYSQV